MKNLPLIAELFILNRKRFVEKLEPNSIAIFNSNDEIPMNGDALYKFKQNTDLYWLTGIEQEDTMLVLFPHNPDPRYREVLVLVRPNELKEKWDGSRLRAKEAQAISGIMTTIWLDTLDGVLQPWIHLADIIYLNTNENDRKANRLEVRDYRYAREMRSRYPLHEYRRSAKIMKAVRGIKTSLEVEVVQQAVDITGKTFRRLLQFIHPGVYEYEIEAEMYHEFLRNGQRAGIFHHYGRRRPCPHAALRQ